MSELIFRSAGESHGPQLTGIIEGLPSGMRVDLTRIDADLATRQQGLGRSDRQKIEADRCVITAGVRHGLTLGSPVALTIVNRDWENWRDAMAVMDEGRPSERGKPLTVPRPGHADLAGAHKRDFADLRNVLERASARETAARVAAGAFAKIVLEAFGVRTVSHTVRIGAAVSPSQNLSVAEIAARIAACDVRCVDQSSAEAMRAEIRAAASAGDTLGGVVEVIATGLVPGLGDYTQWDRRLDARLAAAVMSVPSVKGVEFGLGFAQSGLRGSQVQDEIFYGRSHPDTHSGLRRRTNRAGGLEGGMTNGADLVIRAVAKPLATLNRPLRSVDIHSHEPAEAFVERSDVCSVPAVGVVCEAMAALILADAYLTMFGSGALADVVGRFNAYVARIDRFGKG
jgi:chorismate synthase